MKLSIIIPVLNEGLHIQTLIDSINGIDATQKEILLVDGGSTDGTCETISRMAERYNNIQLINNPDRYVSHGFNRAYKVAKGEYIALVGAHAIYPSEYFSECVKVIDEGLCDASGGFLLQKGRSAKGQAIAKAMSSKFGVGDTAFRTDPTQSYVDSVAFAVYHRRVFESSGTFDEELIRNQDDEFHYRLNRNGFRIMMLPHLKTTYFVRESFAALFRQYFQYGYYKPLVFKKVGSGMRFRHLIPSLFVIYLLSIPISLLYPIYLIPLIGYIILCLVCGLSGNGNLITPVVFPILHIAYGSGFLKGLVWWTKYK